VIVGVILLETSDGGVEVTVKNVVVGVVSVPVRLGVIVGVILLETSEGGVEVTVKNVVVGVVDPSSCTGVGVMTGVNVASSTAT